MSLLLCCVGPHDSAYARARARPDRSYPDPEGADEPRSAHGWRAEEHGAGNLFVVFREPDIAIEPAGEERFRVNIKGVDVVHPQTGEIESGGPDTISLWFIDTDYK